MTLLLKMSLAAAAASGLVVAAAQLDPAAPPEPPPDAPPPRGPDPVRTWTEDATAHYYNGALMLAWQRTLGDWIDRDGVRHGRRAFAAAPLSREGVHDIDVTDLVRRHGADFRVAGRTADIASREAPQGQPLLLVTRGGRTRALPASADVGMDDSTVQSRGTEPSHKLGEGFFIRFDQPADPAVERAVLRLTAVKLWSGGGGRTEIFRPDPRPAEPTMPDVPVGGPADIVMTISGAGWRSGVGWERDADHARVNRDGSLTAWMGPGSDTAFATLYLIPRAQRRPLMCLKTEMTIHKDWTAPIGGKFPGLANTGQAERADDQAGWGGRGADGTRWSARTNRWPHVEGTLFADDWMAIGTYVYRVNADTSHGDQVPLSVPVPKGRRFAYDQCVGLNRPGRADGFVAYWVDGRPAGALGGIVWRTHGGPETLPSEIWANVYEGGTGYDRTPHPRHTVTLHRLTLSTKRLP